MVMAVFIDGLGQKPSNVTWKAYIKQRNMEYELWLNKRDRGGAQGRGEGQKCEGVNYVSELCT